MSDLDHQDADFHGASQKIKQALENKVGEAVEQKKGRLEAKKKSLRAQDFRIIGFYSCFALLGIGVIAYLKYPINSTNIDDFAKTSGIFITFIVGIMASHISRLNARLQVDALSEVEDIKLDNAVTLANIQAEITILVNKASKRFEITLLKEVEEYKEYVRKKNEAYDHLTEAASEYYRCLELLKDGIWNEVKANESYDKILGCERYLSLLPDDYQKAWYRLAQYGKEMIALAKTKDPLPPKAIWLRHGDAFRREYNKILEESSKRRQIASSTTN